MKIKLSLTIAAIAISANAICSTPYSTIQRVSSSNDYKWVEETNAKNEELKTIEISIDTSATAQEVLGFGACFNQLGWEALGLLSDDDRKEIFSELFEPDKGTNFNICRMPVAANDFAFDWYSFNETDGDFKMKNFSIEEDLTTLIPYIKEAKRYRPDLQLWASPWSPPSWMKYNKHYAMVNNDQNKRAKNKNNLSPEQVAKEGEDLFIQEPKYFEAYALYFSKFIKAYRKEGIDIFAVMPQNEFNSPQPFPSCCWTATGLATFIGDYLGPQMEKEGVEVMFGTMERPDARLVDTVLMHPTAKKYVSAVGFQWNGKYSVPMVRNKYPEMVLYQTEQECGNGKNDWSKLTHMWGLLEHYFDNGISAYMYWNIALQKGGISPWGWAQNSLVVVDPESREYTYTNEFYLMKHISHFVKAGSKALKLKGVDDALAFLTPEGEVVVLLFERDGKNRAVNITIDDTTHCVVIPKNSLTTVVLK